MTEPATRSTLQTYFPDGYGFSHELFYPTTLHAFKITETDLKRAILSLVFLAAWFGLPPKGHAAPVEYVKICTSFGLMGYYYLPGTDICANTVTGMTMEATDGGTWSALLPTASQGNWFSLPQLDCAGRLVLVGNFHPLDFVINAYGRYQAPPFNFKLQPGEFISNVLVSGGFNDPIQPLRTGPGLSPAQFCLRVVDPNYSTIDMGGAPQHPYFCSPAPLMCFSNSQIKAIPATYSVPVLGTPVVHYNTDANGKVTGSPATCGSQLLLTTGTGKYDPTVMNDPLIPTGIGSGGTITVWACVLPN